MIETVAKVNIQLLLDKKIAIRISAEDSEDDRSEFFGLLQKMNKKLCTVYGIYKYDEHSFFECHYPHWEYLVAVNDYYEKGHIGIDWCKETYLENNKDAYAIIYSVREFLGNQFVDNTDEVSQMFESVFA